MTPTPPARQTPIPQTPVIARSEATRQSRGGQNHPVCPRVTTPQERPTKAAPPSKPQACWPKSLSAAACLLTALLLHPALANAETWEGTYDCPEAQGRTGLTLTVEPASTGVSALFHFYADPSNPGVPEGCFLMSGTLDPGTGKLGLAGGQWLLQPYGYVAVDMSGQVSPDRQHLEGALESPLCTVFTLRRTLRPAHLPPRACLPGNALVS